MPYLFFLLLLVLLPVYIVAEYKAKSPWTKLALKTACSLLFVLTAVSAMVGGKTGTAATCVLFMAAFLLSAAGDVLLSWPMKQSFLLGLGAFFLAQCAFAVSFSLRWGLSPWDILPYMVLAGGAVTTLLAAPGMEYGTMRLPVSVYALALSAMAAKAISGVYLVGGPWAWVAAAGGLLFYSSDVILAFQLFHRKKPKCLIAWNLATYYLGQGLLAVSLIGM